MPDIVPTLTEDDLNFEQSYLANALPNDTLEATDGDTSLPLAILSASYGYTREGRHSPLLAVLFGFFGYQYPLLTSLAVATDALINTPAGMFAREQFSRQSRRLGFSGINTRRRCRNGYRRRGGVCTRTH